MVALLYTITGQMSNYCKHYITIEAIPWLLQTQCVFFASFATANLLTTSYPFFAIHGTNYQLFMRSLLYFIK